MLIAICSDTHDNELNIKKFLKYCIDHQVDVIFHCGDWTKPAMLEVLRRGFDGEIYGVIGNAKILPDQMLAKANQQAVQLEITTCTVQLDGITFGLAHRPVQARRLAQQGQHDIIFYGHTHRPWQEDFNNTPLVNPGTLAGMFMTATFALYNTTSRKLELIRVDQI